MSQSITVVGCGAAGMAVAYYLRNAGYQVEVIESSPRLGGRMATARLGDRSIALGGKNIGRKYGLFRDFVRGMGNQSFEYFGLNSSHIRKGRIVPFNGERPWSAVLGFLRYCTPRDIVRLLPMIQAIKRDRQNAFLGGPFFDALAEQYRDADVASYFSRQFSNLVRPLSVRMNGAEPDEISLVNFGTNLAMLLDSYEQLSEGLDPIFERFARTIPVRLSTQVQALVVQNGQVTGVLAKNCHGEEVIECDRVILATPAVVSAELVRPHAPKLAQQLASVRYFPVAVVVAEYKRPIFGRKIRALVFPSEKALSNAGVYGVEQRNMVRYTFSGRTARKLLADEPDVGALLNLGEQTLTDFVPVRSQDRIAFIGRSMKIGLCAYSPDHRALVHSMEQATRDLGGLEFTGDYLRGASIEACFQAGRDCADRLFAHNAEIPDKKSLLS